MMLAHPLCLPHGGVLRPRATWSKKPRGWTREGTEKPWLRVSCGRVPVLEIGSLGHPK